MAIRAVLFDLDGTLWSMGGAEANPEFEWSNVTAIQAGGLAPHFRRWGFACDPAAFVTAFFEDLRRLLNPPTPDCREPAWHPALEQTLARFGHRADDRMAEAIFDVLNDVPFHHFGVQPFAEVPAALEKLAASGIRIGAVSNNPKPAHSLAAEMRRQDIPDVFETIVTSWTCGWRKPHHIPFEAALQELGVQPSEAAHVGDSYENDIAPALALGMTAVLRRGRPAPPGAPVPHHEIDSLEELVPLLAPDA